MFQIRLILTVVHGIFASQRFGEGPMGAFCPSRLFFWLWQALGALHPVKGKREVEEILPTPAAYPVLKARKRGLGGQVPAGFGQSPGTYLQSRVAPERLGIVGVFIAKSDGKDPLFEQGEVTVNRLARISRILQTPRSACGNLVALIEQPDDQSASIRGDATTLEVSGHLFSQDPSQTQLVMADCSHKGILAKELYVVSQQHVSRCPCLFEPVFVHNPG
jgi:hypothetical protein